MIYPDFVVPTGKEPKLPLDKALEELKTIYHAASRAKACIHAGADVFVEWQNSAADTIALVYGSDSFELEYLQRTNFGGRQDVSEEDRRVFQEGMQRITAALADWIRNLSALEAEKQLRQATLIRSNKRNVYSPRNSMDTTQINIGPGLRISTAFDEYTLGQLLGQGGNGRVFAAVSTDGGKVAIKILDKVKQSTAIKRFKNEIKFCEQHAHPNIVKIIDHGYFEIGETGYSFYVMPLYEKTLRERMNEGLPPSDALEIFNGILCGLKEAHLHQVVHRDIKPENIMLEANSNVPVICDFGIAHIPEAYMATVVVTKPSERMANWGYAAPEQKKKGGDACYQSDIYAAALILNEMFTGEVPGASGYKKISDVEPNYSYLDDVFAAIYKQNPQDRLYPEDRIFTEMKVRADIHGNTKAIERLKSIAENRQADAIQCPHVISKSYNSGILNFEFDIPIPREWLTILNEGSFSHSWVTGYDTNRVVRGGDRILQLEVQGLGAEDISRVVECFYAWVTAVNAKYTDMLTVLSANKKREEDAQRKREIARLEEENRIRDVLARI